MKVEIFDDTIRLTDDVGKTFSLTKQDLVEIVKKVYEAWLKGKWSIN